jgi:hypothetical protein
MRPSTFICTGFAALALATCPIAAQTRPDIRSRLHVADSTELQILTLRGGSTLVGRITSIGADSLTIDASVGNVSLPISSVTEVKSVAADRMKEGEYWFPNPNSTRLFFAPSGRMLERGDGYVSDYEVFFPGAAYGVTDNVSIGGGMSLFPAGIDQQLFYFTPRSELKSARTSTSHSGRSSSAESRTKRRSGSYTESERSDLLTPASRRDSATALPEPPSRAIRWQ